MKQNKQNRTPVLIAIGLFGLFLGGSLVAAYPTLVGVKIMDEDRDALREALEKGDYEQWRETMIAQLTEERFQQMSERYNAVRNRHESIHAAIESEDYSAWVEAMTSEGQEPRILDYISEENFGTLVELHEARDAGEIERVKELMEELGFPEYRGKRYVYSQEKLH